MRTHDARKREPAEAVLDFLLSAGVFRPQRRVALPEPRDDPGFFAFRVPIAHRLFVRPPLRGGRGETAFHFFFSPILWTILLYASQKSSTPAFSRPAVTSASEMPQK